MIQGINRACPDGGLAEQALVDILGDTMKRIRVLVACIAVGMCVTGCNAMNYLWQRIIGHGYSQLDMASLEALQERASPSILPGNSLAANTVLGYKTRHGNPGKLGILSTPTASGITFEFTTYSILDGSVLTSSRSVTLTGDTLYDLEGGVPGTSVSGSDFLWQSDATLVPQGAPNKAEFYIMP
jgi:hypothetical protein